MHESLERMGAMSDVTKAALGSPAEGQSSL